MKKTMIASLAAAGMLFAVWSSPCGNDTDAVKKKGFVQCGISDGLPGFSYADANGNLPVLM
jgi:general L-amino acid transport system substrate-binding protein